ncbi:coiled-coil domain-containing protein 181-like isoform X2 [Watersipora subatra]|uniref:coiled-coil domain-containing protein 181-like isoform X2 n=1 Tax=Watersipora subatra TaxID=2589382 RepID=UPI00355B7B9C
MDENVNSKDSRQVEEQQDKDNSDYELTDEQREAVLQMQQMQGERLEDDEWDPASSAFVEIDYSTFVSQRLKEVNEQWDKEPLPTNHDRHTMIEFKKDQELTSVYAPQPYPVEEGEDKVDNFTPEDNTEDSEKPLATRPDKQTDSTSNEHSTKLTVSSTGETSNVLPGEPLAHDNDSISKPNKKKKSARFANMPHEDGNETDEALDTDANSIDHTETNTNNSATVDQTGATEEQVGGRPHDTDNISCSSSSNQDNNRAPGSESKDEKMLIELNGKFELVSVKELQAMGYPLPETLTTSASCSPATPESYSYHARTNRPASFGGARSASPVPRREKKRAQSATTTRPANQRQDWDISHYVSPYALSPEQKEYKERREKVIKEREKTEQQRKKEEERRKQEEAESAFQWWLETKEQQRQKQLNGEEDEEARKKENVKAFDKWCEAKKDQQKKERLLKNREQKERDDAYFIRSRDECEQAFKKWLRNKRKDQQSIHMMSTNRYMTKRKHSRSKSAKANNRSIKAEWNTRLC